MTDLLSAEGLHKQFGSGRGAIKAVDGVTLKVAAGTVLGFLGPNGAGKTTTMRLITGFLTPDSGAVALNGHDLFKDPLSARQQVGYLPEGAPAYPDMRVGEFLQFIAQARGLGKASRSAIDVAVGRLGLENVWKQPIETLSKGFKRRVGFAQAIVHDPPILILDEPTDGLDPNQKFEVRRLIREMAGMGEAGSGKSEVGSGAKSLQTHDAARTSDFPLPTSGGAVGKETGVRKQETGGSESSSPESCVLSPVSSIASGGKVIVLSTHILEEVEAVCSRAVLIDKGKVKFDGTPPEMEALAPASVTRNRLDHVFRMLTTGQPTEQTA